MSVTRVKNWEEWFLGRESNILIDQSKQEILLLKYDANTASDKVVKNLEDNKEIIFVFCKSFGDKMVNIFHHFKRFGGLITNPKETYTFLRGVKERAVFAMQVNKKTLSKNTSILSLALPTLKDLKLVKKKENIASLDLSIRNHCLTKNFIPIPPFLLNTVFKVINKTQGDAKELYVEILKEMK